MKIFNFLPPYPDELLYSVLLRNAAANVMDLDAVRAGFKMNAYSSKATVRYDSLDYLSCLFSAFGMDAKAGLEFFYRTSIFPGFSPLLTEFWQTSAILRCFQARTAERDLIFDPRQSLPQVRLCPRCAGEDMAEFGEFYLRRAHQMPGVCACYKHECPLLEYTQKKGRELESIEGYKPVVAADKLPPEATAFARYAKDFLMEGYGFTVMDILPDIRTHSELKDQLYKVSPDPDSIPAYFFSGSLNRDMLNISNVAFILQLMYLSGASIDIGPVKMRKRCVGAHKVLREYANVILTKHTPCGTTVITTRHAVTMGWACPVCDRKLSADDLFQKVTSAAGSGEFACAKTDAPGKIELTHRCGKTRIEPTARYLEGAVRCDCRNKYSEEDVKGILKKAGYDLLSYVNTTEPVKYYHPECGSVFKRSFYTVMRALDRCPVCRSATKGIPDRLHVEMLTGTEYTFIDRLDEQGKIIVRHNICGKNHIYRRKSFFAGSRCPFCKESITPTVLCKIVKEVSLGRFDIVGHSRRNYVVRDSTSGKEKSLTKARILQELRRPTQSSILPLIKKGEWRHYFQATGVEKIAPETAVLRWLKENYALDSIIISEEIALPPKTRAKGFKALCKKGILKRIIKGIYVKEGTDLTDTEIIKKMYAGDAGFFLNPAYFTGSVEGLPEEVYIISSCKGKKIFGGARDVLGHKIRYKRAAAEITPDNSEVIKALEYISSSIPKKWPCEGLVDYLSKKGVEHKDFEPYLGLYGKPTRRKLNKLYAQDNTG